MTYKTKKIIGHVLLLQIIPIVIYCWYSIQHNLNTIESGRKEILFTLKGTEKDKQNFNINYPFSHGVYVLNARWCEEGEKPTALLNDGNYETSFCSSDKGTAINIPTKSKLITVTPVNSFKGEFIFKNTVCGCEALMNLVYFIGGGVSSLLLILIATVLYFRANKQKKTLLTSTNVEEL